MSNFVYLTIYLLLVNSSVHSNPSHLKGGGNILYDNGPMVTSTSSGPNGEDESILENVSLNMSSFGTAHQSSNNFRVADEFTITGNDWTITSLHFFAYQTGEIASTITSVNLRIWDGIPGMAGSNVVFGDTTTNVLTNTTNSGILRVNQDNAGANVDRQIADTMISINLTLPAGTYWLDWQSDGSGLSGPFVPHITIPGQLTTGNALLSTDNGVNYSNLLDTGSLTQQGLPFIIRGNIVNLEPIAVPISGMTLIMVLSLMIIFSLFIREKRQLNCI